VSDLAALLTAIGGLITAIGGAVALVMTSVRTSRRERPKAARNLLAELAEAAEDGEITGEELRDILAEHQEDDDS
jgi:hypothetical protein